MQEKLGRGWALKDRRWAQPLMAWSHSRGPSARRTDWGDELQRKQKHSSVLPRCPSLGATTITSSTRLIARKCPFVISSQSFRFRSYIDIFSPFPVGLRMLELFITFELLGPSTWQKHCKGEGLILVLSFSRILASHGRESRGKYLYLLCCSGTQGGSHDSQPGKEEHRLNQACPQQRNLIRNHYSKFITNITSKFKKYDFFFYKKSEPK